VAVRLDSVRLSRSNEVLVAKPMSVYHDEAAMGSRRVPHLPCRMGWTCDKLELQMRISLDQNAD
jgi:hypothetical protein